MAGKRQHFIPRFIQKGFSSRVTKSGTFTWVFRRGVPPFNTNIVNVGEEGQFYTYNSDVEADVLITRAESEFSDLLHSIRGGVASSLSDLRLPQMIAHLEVRTRHLRKSLESLGNSVVSDLLAFVSDEEAFASWIKDAFRRNSPKLREMLVKEFSGVPSNLLEPAVQLAMSLGPSFVDQRKPYLSKLVAEFRSALPGMTTQATKSGHIEALKQGIAPEAKAERYSSLIYAIIPNTERDPLILGDSIVLFQVDGAKPYKPYLEAKDKLVAVYLPIDSDQVLVGTQQGRATFPADLRREIARCSLEHFIAPENTEANQALQGSIGSAATLLTEEESKALVERAIREHF